MDAGPHTRLPDPLVVTGAGAVVGAEPDVLPWLASRKMRKFMGKQDRTAVVAAGLAAREAGAGEALLRDRTGIYLSVGYIPFERAEVEAFAYRSAEDGRFSAERFSTDGYEAVSPLTTFRVLPNMPAFHVSLNLGVRGPYFVTYPGAGQFYTALERAASALRRREVDLALVGGVADQRNFLVEHHFARTPGGAELPLADAAAFICLERAGARDVPAAFELVAMAIDYRPCAPARHRESPAGKAYLGPASLPALLARSSADVAHEVETLDSFHASSRWRRM